MRLFSKVNNSIWASKRYKKLSDKHKLFYIYCLTCPHGNSAGCFISPIGYMMVGMCWKEAEIVEAIEKVSATGLIAYDRNEDTLYIDRWFDFNSPTNPKHALKVFSDTLSVPDSKLKNRCILELKRFVENKDWKVNEKLQEELDRVSRLGDTETETETETVLDIDAREGEKKLESFHDFLWPGTGEILNFQMLFEKIWNEYPDQKPKGNKKPAYEKLKKIISPKNYKEIINGVMDYKNFCDVTGSYNQHLITWLNQSGWVTDWKSQTKKGKENGKTSNNVKQGSYELAKQAAMRGYASATEGLD